MHDVKPPRICKLQILSNATAMGTRCGGKVSEDEMLRDFDLMGVPIIVSESTDYQT
jgi:hypothetical protein